MAEGGTRSDYRDAGRSTGDQPPSESEVVGELARRARSENHVAAQTSSITDAFGDG
jgi:hypothetical protein